MDLDARMAAIEARVRALDAITFGQTQHGNIPADEYFAAREVGGEVGQLAYGEQATRQRATEEDWNRLLADQLAKKQAEAGVAHAISDGLNAFEQALADKYPEMYPESDWASNTGDSIYVGPSGRMWGGTTDGHTAMADYVVTTVDRDRYATVDRWGGALKDLMATEGHFVRLYMFVKGRGLAVGLDVDTPLTSAQLRTLNAIFQDHLIASLGLRIHGHSQTVYDWSAAQAALREQGMSPTTMADAVDSLTVAPAINAPPPNAPTTAGEMIAELDGANFVDLGTVETMLGQRPDYLDAVVQFIMEQREKLRAGMLMPRDVAKAYVITVGSQRAAAIDPSIIKEKSGFVVPERFTTVNQFGARVVRPEDAIGAWLLAPEGQHALDAADQCQLDFASWNLLAWMRQAWGIDQYLRLNVFGGRGALRTGSPARDAAWYNMTNVCALTDALNECHGDSGCLDGVIARVSGVGTGKLGFMKHLVGLGDTPTVDAIETNFWLTGQADVRQLNDEDGRLVRSTTYWEHDRTVREYLLGRFRHLFQQMRAAGIGADLDPDVYAHIVHHWLWDKAKGTRTEHVGMYEGQMFGATLPPTFEETVALMREKRAEQATLMDTTPNLRDFYPDRDAYDRAIAKHSQRHAELQAELEALGAHRNQLRQSRGATLAENPELTGLLTDALASEHQAIDMYDNIVGKAGLEDNPARLVAESILVDEQEHASKLDTLLHQPDVPAEHQEPGQSPPPVADECGPVPMPDAVMAQCEQEPPMSPSGDVAEWVSAMTGSPGIVVDAEEAGRYPCLRVQLRPGHNLVYQKGIIGPLDADQQALYCQQGYADREPTVKQRERMSAMSDAAKLCKVESIGSTTQEHLVRYFACLGRELKAKGVNL